MGFKYSDMLTKFTLIMLLAPWALGQEITVVRGSDNYPPYEMEVGNKLTGFHIELITNVANSLDIKVHFNSYPWKRALSMVKSGDVHAISFVGESVNRSKYIIFTPGNELSFSHSGLVVLAPKKSLFHFNGKHLNNLRHHKFGHNLGFIYGGYYDNANLNKTSFNTTEQLLGMLRLGRIDIAIINFGTFKHLQDNDAMASGLLMLDKKVAFAHYLGFSRAWKLHAMSQKFAAAMQAYKKSSEFFALMKKYQLKKSQVSNFPP